MTNLRAALIVVLAITIGVPLLSIAWQPKPVCMEGCRFGGDCRTAYDCSSHKGGPPEWCACNEGVCGERSE